METNVFLTDHNHTDGGYTCPSCGVWVPGNMHHVCYPSKYGYGYDDDDTIISYSSRRLIYVLERIAKALEELNKKL